MITAVPEAERRGYRVEWPTCEDSSFHLGLPFLRTSVDHGAAFDIAGTGKASEVSMVEAVSTAARYAPRYRENALK